jgi:D-hexose-6-phosphate mutarotase
LDYKVLISDTLTVTLTSHNDSDRDMRITEALHSYFLLEDISQTRISGLDGCDYIDTVSGRKNCTQAGDIAIAAEVDRVYLGTRDDCLIVEHNSQHQIKVTKSGSDSTVVWNPWIDKAKRMVDVNDNGYQHFVCVESANAFDNVVVLKPGEQHNMSQSISQSFSQSSGKSFSQSIGKSRGSLGGRNQ